MADNVLPPAVTYEAPIHHNSGAVVGSASNSTIVGTKNETHHHYPDQSLSDRKEREMNFLTCLKTSKYRDGKDRNPDRVLETCDWFVSHELFRDWQGSNLSRMLWVSADPGCGKSVLSKYLVDSVLPNTESRTTCYFFFKDEFEDQRNVESALCCILHQLFMHKRNLISDAILDQFDIEKKTLTSSFSELWDILIKAAQDHVGEIICLLDAIDECEDQGMSKLAQKLCQLYGTKANFKLKFLLTSRPYGEIRRGFEPLNTLGLPKIHLSGESDVEMEKISQEINVFIRARVLEVKGRLKLNTSESDLLLRELMRVPNRTYLWVHITLDLIEKDINIDKRGITEITSHLPKTIEEAYERILSKSTDFKKAEKILHIVVAAARPLILTEMILALTLRVDHKSYSKLDLMQEDRFRENVRDICGLFVTIINSKIYLLHQTVKEFLVQNDTVNPHTDLKWKHSLQPQESHRILSEICIWHLLLAEFDTHPLEANGSVPQYLKGYTFLDYSAKHWAAQLLHIEIQDAAMTQTVLKICDVRSRRCQTWFRIYWTSTNTDFPLGFTSLMIASYLGLSTAVNSLLKMDSINLDSQDRTYQRSALSWAAGNGFDVVVRQLIKGASISLKYFNLPFKKGAKVDSVDRHGRTPLSYAVWNGSVAVVKLLIQAGARVDLEDEIGGMPLSYAVVYGREEVIKLLLKRGTMVDSEEDITSKLLPSAARKGHEAVVKLLLETGKVNAISKEYGLSGAASNGHEAIVKLLLETGKVDANSMDDMGQTPLSRAAEKGHEVVVKLLLETGKVDANSMDHTGRTPLSQAAENGHEAVVKLLLETGKVDANSKDHTGQTPLSLAAENGHTAVAKLLLKTGKVNADQKDNFGQTPLSLAAENGHEAVVKLLLKTDNVDANSKDNFERTPLSLAAKNGHEAVVKLLLETGKVNADQKDGLKHTPLSRAAGNGHEAIVKLLLETGKVDADSMDHRGQTPLSWAAENGHEPIVKLLLKSGKVDVDSKDFAGRTPLSWATKNGHKAVVKLLRSHHNPPK